MNTFVCKNPSKVEVKFYHEIGIQPVATSKIDRVIRCLHGDKFFDLVARIKRECKRHKCEGFSLRLQGAKTSIQRVA